MPASASSDSMAPGSGSRGPRHAEKPANGGSDAAKNSPPTAAAPEQLADALKAKKPGFSGEVQMEPISADLLAVAINDPNVKDISPLLA